jgi:AhpD family alkylhydroperoxidase
MRIQGLEKNQVSWMLRPLYGVMRRRFGKVLSPFKVWAYRPAITLGLAGLAQAVEHSKAVAPRTKNLASVRAAQLVGCSFCIDIGSAIAVRLGVSEETLAALDSYDENPLFTPAERAAIRYAEEMTRTPVEVSDELFAELRRHFDDRALVDLTAAIALENLHARFNWAFQIESDGLCRLPANRPAPTSPVPSKTRATLS